MNTSDNNLVVSRIGGQEAGRDKGIGPRNPLNLREATEPRAVAGSSSTRELGLTDLRVSQCTHGGLIGFQKRSAPTRLALNLWPLLPVVQGPSPR